MKNILGKEEDLKFYNKNGQRVYSFIKDFNGVSCEYTYDQNGNSTKPLLSSRLFKFRAWVRNELMVNVVSIDFNNEYITWDDNQYDRCVPPNKCYEIETFDDIVLMQFTGLSDKNGSKIFEGDIVTYKRSVGNWTGQTMTTTHKIIFTEEVNAFVMDYGSSYIKLRKHWGYEYEVIGNIFKNTELL